MPWLIARVVALGVPSGYAKPLLAVVGGLLLILALWGLKTAYDNSVVDKHEQKLEHRAAPATNKAAEERANDAITNAKHEEDMHNAVHSVPDAAPAAPSHALACERLRRRGNPPTACR
jgi:hypothetical protein